jgi:hypothetical protein
LIRYEGELKNVIFDSTKKVWKLGDNGKLLGYTLDKERVKLKNKPPEITNTSITSSQLTNLHPVIRDD